MQSSHRGDLLLLRVWPTVEIRQGESWEEWKIEVLARRAMPDPVWAVARLTDNFVVASVGNRLVCYELSEGKWSKRGWIVAHDKITSLSTTQSALVVAAGDRHNSVVLYEYSILSDTFRVRLSVHRYSGWKSYLLLVFSTCCFHVVKVVSCDPCRRTNTGVFVSGYKEPIFAIDAEGCFCSLDPVPDEGDLQHVLREKAVFDVGEPLVKLVPLEGKWKLA